MLRTSPWLRLYRGSRPIPQVSGQTRCLHQLPAVRRLDSWELSIFREEAFKAALPAKLPAHASHTPEACSKWFIHDGKHDFDLSNQSPQVSELRTAFWSEHEDTIVPLELTLDGDAESGIKSYFQRSEAPLKILLSYLANPMSPSSKNLKQTPSIYLAQWDLASLPKTMIDDLPTPDLVLLTGRGDIYSSSLWLGRPPTYTPLHRDPNPNLFIQLTGQKIVRLLPPSIGEVVYDYVRAELRNSCPLESGTAAVRGDEMMQGQEKELFHEIVWGDEAAHKHESLRGLFDYAQETHLALGEALFIPKGWWHSVKGVGQGVTASANWWFR